MAERRRLRSLMRATLASRADVQSLFVAATTLDDVLTLLAGIYCQGSTSGAVLEGEQSLELPDILLRGLEHCRAKIEREQLLTQPEWLAISIAELVANDPLPNDPRLPELADGCALVRARQRQRRLEGMNMGRD